MIGASEPLKGVRRSDRPTTFDAGRVCELTTCSTVLSRYNGGTRCWEHESVRSVPERPTR